ncbi:hypothetical protein CCACVL1_21111 [Corchorus capsularis]|uniref:Uncharacterized protein n=1 Tax=Corchorus capsularis TaxID=210143 RepID=A0A1R3H845_COCAP|nr:hypothetical protein CCACVL1_21111 [Corchorus capsularis]
MLSSKSIFTSSFSETKWVEEITAVMKNNKQAKEVLVSVYEVPEALRSVNPEAYTPQLLAFGPYHHFKQKLYQMQRFKVAAATKAQTEWLAVEFEKLVAQIRLLALNVQTCYQTHLDIQKDTLALLMAIDGLALLKVLHSSLSYYKNPDKSLTNNPFSDFYGRSPDLDMILRDMLMLENQIPMIVLAAIAENCHEPNNNLQYFVEFIEPISPLQLATKVVPASEIVNYKHLLDLFYHLLCPKEDTTSTGHIQIEIPSSIEMMMMMEDSDSKSPNSNFLRKLLLALSAKLRFRKSGEKAEENSSNRKDHQPPDCGVFKKFLASLSNFQFRFAALPEMLVNLLLTSLELLGISAQDFFDKDRAWIPTASQLAKTGVKFNICQGIRNIEFDKKNLVLQLPVITLNDKRDQDEILSSKRTTEVILRNLIAFESLSKDQSQSLTFTRYTQLMNGLIDNDNDADVLKGAHIIKGDLASVEIANLFNGLSETIEPKDRDINIDEAINNINRYYDNTLRVKINKLLKKYIYSSWRFLTVLTTFLLLAMMALETFCGFYECKTVRFKSS